MTECPSWSSEFELLLNGFEELKSSSSLENPDHHLAGTGRQIGLHGAHSGYGHGCCPLVFNPSTLLALLAGIALATYFLRIVIVTSTIMGRSWVLDSPFGEIGGSCMNISFKKNLIHKTVQCICMWSEVRFLSFLI